MVTIEKQFELACNLARENGHARVAFVCSLSDFNRLGRESGITDCVFYLQRGEVAFANGGLVKWVKPSAEEMVSRYCASMFTSIFFGSDTEIPWIVRDYIRSRLRSSTYNLPLKTYYPSGHAVWEESEIYGS